MSGTNGASRDRVSQARPTPPGGLTDLGERFAALRLLGEGGMGRVYLAREEGTRGDIAIKVLHRELASQTGEVARFLAAGRAARAVVHPCVARVLDVGVLSDGRPFWTMAVVEGVELPGLFAEDSLLAPRQCVDLGLQACGALAAIHACGLVHLDIKPTNFVVSADGRLTLLDLGISCAEGTKAIFPGPDGRALGTPEYWSPEQASCSIVDRRSDVYSLGVVLYEALSGRVPFRSHTYTDLVLDHLGTTPPGLRRPDVPRELEAVVLRCLAKRPEDRYPSAEALAAALSTLERNVGRQAVEKRNRGRRRGSFARWGALSIACLAAGVLAWSASDDSTPPAAAPSARATIRVRLTSEPAGAVVYRAEGGAPLGRTPFGWSGRASAEPRELLFRFPDGDQRIVSLVPEGEVHAHVESSGRLRRQGRGR